MKLIAQTAVNTAGLLFALALSGTPLRAAQETELKDEQGKTIVNTWSKSRPE